MIKVKFIGIRRAMESIGSVKVTADIPSHGVHEFQEIVQHHSFWRKQTSMVGVSSKIRFLGKG